MPVIDLTKSRATELSIEEAIERAGPEGAVVVPAGTLRKLVRPANLIDPERVFTAAMNGMLYLQQGRPGVLPDPEDGRQLVRVAREIADEIENPTPEPEEHARRYVKRGTDGEDYQEE